MGASLLCVPCRHKHSANPLYYTTVSRLKTVSGQLYLAASKDGAGPTLAAEGRYETLGRVADFPVITVAEAWIFMKEDGGISPTRTMYFVFCRPRLFLPQPPRQCLASTVPVISLLLTNTAPPCAGLPIHMMGEASWEPKRRRAWAS
jgi:hypothetical protein